LQNPELSQAGILQISALSLIHCPQL
jgi:hypothetical protein